MFVEKGTFFSILNPQESFLPCESQCFVEKGYFLSPQMSAFLKIRVIFLEEKSVERGIFQFFRTIIRLTFMFEWRDRDGEQ